MNPRSRRADVGKLLPPETDWRTSDDQEILKRQLRAREEKPRVVNQTPAHGIFSNFEVHSRSGLSYQVEIRDVANRQFACTCTDFRINGLRTCKHVEAVLLTCMRRNRPDYTAARRGAPSPRIDIVPDLPSGRLQIERNLDHLPDRLKSRFDAKGLQLPDLDPADLVREAIESGLSELRVSVETTVWLAARERALDSLIGRRNYEAGVAAGRYPAQETLHPLFPYQREGMLHLAFKERALLADEMGLGKTIQAIAACALLHRIGRARRVLVVTPASLKAEWEEQIRTFTPLTQRILFGSRAKRVRAYSEPEPPVFTIANYEQIVADSLDINERLRPDIVVLDEAQRIKNWSTRTAQAVKRLRSRYAFVLTGTPIENRIDELYSIVDFLDPTLLGPLFRFNRTYYSFDDKGRPEGYRNLSQLRESVQPLLLRRRKADVETELPDRTDRNLFVRLTDTMRSDYAEHERSVAELVQISKRRPLTPREQDLLMVLMNLMRMICDTPEIIRGNSCRDCPKLDELARVLEEVLADPDVKVIVFSEWEGMLARVREHADKLGIGYAWHTGSVPQQKRRAEILAFRNVPSCRLFLSTDSGGVGLNLQNASVVINCDLPWNPAKLEQRIARAWRKNQRRSVTVVNLIAEGTIEHGMLAGLADKRELALGVIDGVGGLDQVKFKRGRQETLKRLEQALATGTERLATQPPAGLAPGADPSSAFAASLRVRLGGCLIRCDEAWLPGSDTPVLLAVIRGAAGDLRPLLETMLKDTPWHGPRPPLHVIDESAWASLQSLISAGVLALNSRVLRPLMDYVGDSSGAALSPEQRIRVDTLNALVRRKARAARVLLSEELLDEALSPLKEAILAFAQAAAVFRSVREPASHEELCSPPYAMLLPADRISGVAAVCGATPDAAAAAGVVKWLETA